MSNTLSNLEVTPKIDVKVYARESEPAPAGPVATEELIPVFHRWIRESAIDSLLIDVADYSHVPDGPGVVLIGHDAHWSLDHDGGRRGLQLSRRRETHPSLAGLAGLEARLHSALVAALEACALLEREPTLGGRLRFATNALRVRINDRLTSNTPQTLERVRAALDATLRALWPGATITALPDEDPRALATLHLEVGGTETSTAEVSVDTLLSRLRVH
jgi:hypothetical protein